MTLLLLRALANSCGHLWVLVTIPNCTCIFHPHAAELYKVDPMDEGSEFGRLEQQDQLLRSVMMAMDVVFGKNRRPVEGQRTWVMKHP